MAIIELYDPRRKDRMVYTKSGLNWCFAKTHVSPNDAYLVLRKSFLRANSDLFPPHGCRINVVWDDGVEMVCSLEGTQELDGVRMPKQISTYNNKSILGSYLRNRLNVSSDHIITYQDLQNYGRDHIEVTLMDDGRYFFDFSVNNGR